MDKHEKDLNNLLWAIQFTQYNQLSLIKILINLDMDYYNNIILMFEWLGLMFT